MKHVNIRTLLNRSVQKKIGRVLLALEIVVSDIYARFVSQGDGVR